MYSPEHLVLKKCSICNQMDLFLSSPANVCTQKLSHTMVTERKIMLRKHCSLVVTWRKGAGSPFFLTSANAIPLIILFAINTALAEHRAYLQAAVIAQPWGPAELPSWSKACVVLLQVSGLQPGQCPSSTGGSQLMAIKVPKTMHVQGRGWTRSSLWRHFLKQSRRMVAWVVWCHHSPGARPTLFQSHQNGAHCLPAHGSRFALHRWSTPSVLLKSPGAKPDGVRDLHHAGCKKQP